MVTRSIAGRRARIALYFPLLVAAVVSAFVGISNAGNNSKDLQWDETRLLLNGINPYHLFLNSEIPNYISVTILSDEIAIGDITLHTKLIFHFRCRKTDLDSDQYRINSRIRHFVSTAFLPSAGYHIQIRHVYSFAYFLHSLANHDWNWPTWPGRHGFVYGGPIFLSPA
jgi:hypothetical protein